MAALLFEVATRDAWSLALPLGILLAAASVAAAVPAWRAARVDPAIALRNEYPPASSSLEGRPQR